jgi:hypothetical protein
LPLVLAENEDTESGIRYEDRTGVRYQYPKQRYKNLIRSGERFVYYRGRKRKSGGRMQQLYFGTGVIGDTRDDPSAPGRMLCDVLDYRPFESPVPFRIGTTDYLEAGGRRKGYYQQGVRRIAEGEFRRILELAEANSPRVDNDQEEARAGDHYASPDAARMLEEFSVQQALSELASRFPGQPLKKMPRNNPGFDILIGKEPSQTYVEVKGTQSRVPRFYLSEGERRFSHEHCDMYLVVVFYGVDLRTGNFKVHWHRGAVKEPTFVLKPIQWIVAPSS